MNKLYIGIGILVCYLILSSLFGFYKAIHPERIHTLGTPDTYQVPYEHISFLTEDDIRIRGWFIPNENLQAKTIILLHGYPVDKGDLLRTRIILHKKFNLLMIDFRGLGESDGFISTFGQQEVYDLEGAVKFLKQRGINEVGVWGLSMGGAVALLGAPKIPEIKALVIESSYARLDMMLDSYYKIPVLKYPLALLTRLWGKLFLGFDVKKISPMDAAAKLNIPVLLIHSRTDDFVSFQHALLLQKALIHNPKAIFVFHDKAKHGEINLKTVELISDFFEVNL